jgi:hypothetical protein
MRSLTVMLGVAIVLPFFLHSQKPTPPPPASTGADAPTFKTPTTLRDLLKLPDDQIEQLDIGLIDLLGAEGLPGSEHLDIQQSLNTLDQWAQYVQAQTRNNFHQFEENPDKFKSSLVRYRMALMAAVLTKQLGMHYNPEREKQLENGHTLRTEADELSFFADSSDLFLHGLLSENRYGTCASMPFLYVAIGRRLGYPVTLATTRSHFYVRYEEGDGKHLNVEATEHRGFVTPSDDEYRNPWEMHVSQEEIDGEGMLRPMTNKEILGHILATRASCLRSAGRHHEEAEAWTAAARYLPNTPRWKDIVANMRGAATFDELKKWKEALWQEVARCRIPRGPGFAYFQDQKVRLHFFMNHSLDKAAIQKAAEEFKSQIAGSGRMSLRFTDSPVQFRIAPESSKGQLMLRYVTRSGTEVRIPADFLPPFNFHEIPRELEHYIAESHLEDADSILEAMWQYYDNIAQAKANARLQQMTSIAPVVMISETSVPPEFRQSVPAELEARIAGLRRAQDIVNEMWAYRIEQEVRRRQAAENTRMTLRTQAITLMRRHGISPSTPNPPAPVQPSATPPDKNPIPPAYREWITPEVASRLTTSEIWQLQQNEKNRQVAELAQEQIRSAREANRPKQLPSYQIVTADIAERNPAVEPTTAPPLPSQGKKP